MESGAKRFAPFSVFWTFTVFSHFASWSFGLREANEHVEKNVFGPSQISGNSFGIDNKITKLLKNTNKMSLIILALYDKMKAKITNNKTETNIQYSRR